MRSPPITLPCDFFGLCQILLSIVMSTYLCPFLLPISHAHTNAAYFSLQPHQYCQYSIVLLRLHWVSGLSTVHTHPSHHSCLNSVLSWTFIFSLQSVPLSFNNTPCTQVTFRCFFRCRECLSSDAEVWCYGKPSIGICTNTYNDNTEFLAMYP